MSFARVLYRRKIITGLFCQNAVFEFDCHNHSSSETGLRVSQTVCGGFIPVSSLCCSGNLLTCGTGLTGASAFLICYGSKAIVYLYCNWLKPLQFYSYTSSAGFLIKELFAPEKD